ncbi:MAG: hypothetical protein IKL55_00610 [Clostridia bacterium]|nr:hypothetical protein [Clostridia bacterium]
MRGKIVNLCIGLMNILFGILIIAYTMVIPQDKTIMTVQENNIVTYVIWGIYILMFITAIINIIQSYHHRSDTVFNTAYLLGAFIISFLFIKEPIIAIFSITSGIIIFFKSLKENLVELNSMTAISIAIVIMVITVILSIFTLNYDSIGKYIKNKENENELKYKSDYFKYITELEGELYETPYLNVKKDGKFGYINTKGECMIDFLYDYASPFVEITAYDKKFHIAFVCKDGSTTVILKNGRAVLSYRTEIVNENYQAKIQELENIYKNLLGQTGNMVYEIPLINSNISSAPVYLEVSPEYSFRYDYNEEYDLIVTQSNMGLGDTYELAKKDDLDIRIKLDTTNLDYDSSNLYLFSNGNIPFYELSRRTQGWYTPYGKKNSMTGRAQILEFYGNERILLKNYNDKTVYFTDLEGNKLSETYKDIFVCNDGRYIVQDEENAFKIIDDSYNLIFEQKYAAINPRFVSQGLYLVMDSSQGIKANEYKFAMPNWKLMNYDGEIIFEGIEQIYDLIYEIPNENEDKEVNYEIFEKRLKALNYKFVGDRFYSEY